MAHHPIIVIANSGPTPEARKELAGKIQAAFDEASVPVAITTLSKGQDFSAVCEELVKDAKQHGGSVVAAGGDGSVNLVAGLCYKHGVTLGIIPMGTFNYFARNLQIPTDLEKAVEVIAQGHVRKATLGFLNERIFLNKVSFGLWTKLIRQREEATSLFGRFRIVAVIAAIRSFLQTQKIFSIRMDSSSQSKEIRTSMIFVCNNSLQMENFGLKGEQCTKRHQLAVIALKEANRFQVMRFLIRGFTKNLADEERISEFCSGEFTMSSHRKRIDLVIDGEIVRCDTPLHFHTKPEALNVIAPKPDIDA